MKLAAILLASGLSVTGGLPPYFQQKAGSIHPARRKIPVQFARASDGSYVARSGNFALSVEPTESRILWPAANGRPGGEVSTRLVGSKSTARLEAAAQAAGTVNYFRGDAAYWRVNENRWQEVWCREAYSGIDMVFHSRPDEIEYDFIAKPHSNPAMIRLEFTGQKAMSLTPEGDLVVATAGGEIRWKRPEIYQNIDGRRRHIEGRFVLANRNTVRFKVGTYDQNRDLVIDPTLSYSTFLGGSGDETARGIAVDAAGNVYIAGETSSVDLPVLSAFQNAHGGQSATQGAGDCFIAKFSPAGALVYLTYLGGSADDAAMAIAVDGAGNAYVTGFTTSSDFPIAGAAPFQPHFGGLGGPNWYHTGDAFVAKINPAGNKLIYSTYLGGSSDDVGMGIVLDSLGDVFIAGGSASPNFPTTANAFQSRIRGYGGEPAEPCCGGPFIEPGDAFVAELDPSGSKLLLSTLVGGSNDDMATTIALDSSGSIYIAGYTMSTDFPTTSGALQRSWGGYEQQTPYFVTGDGFIAKLNPALSSLVYSTYFGGSGDECIAAIAVDSTNSVYFTGWSSTTQLPVTAGAAQKNYAGYQALPFLIEYLFGDAVVGKLNAAGSQLLYLTYLGGSQNDAGTAIAVDASGTAYVTGFTDSRDFPVTAGAVQTAMAGDGGPVPPYISFGDGFLAAINPAGTAFSYSTYFGGNRDDMLLAIALDGGGKVYLAGNALSSNWPTTSNAMQPKSAGASPNDFPQGDAVFTVFSGFSSVPTIVKIANAEGEAPAIAPNTWIEIKGSGLASVTRTWQAGDFVNNQMPTALSGTSVTLNGKSAFVYYVSPSQVNVLTPPDLAAGAVQAIVTANGTASAAFSATAQQYSPSFFVFNGGPYVAATHLNGSLIGPSALYPGATTPAAAGETVVLYANGFGPVNPPVVSGSATQTGTLPALPIVRIGSTNANVRFAGLVSPGLYQFNVDVPAGATSGDNSIVATFSSTSTQSGTLITIR